MSSPDGPRAAIAQDWLAAEAGSEHVAVELGRLLPRAEIYTSFFDPRIFDRAVQPSRVHTWPLQRVPGAARRFRALLPLYPMYFARLDLRAYDLVVSSSVAFTHAVRTAPTATHIAYVYTPLRYAWDLEAYLEGSSWPRLAKAGAKALRSRLQRWDLAAAARPDVVVAISEAVGDRIRRTWQREAEVIYPPVDVDSISLSKQDDGFLLVAARMLAYRRLDIAVEAARRLERELVVVGDGPERRRLELLAGPRARFLGRVARPQLLDLFGRCHAYLVPGVEDFGIAPVEAMAAGKPVVGFQGGGVAETVIDGETGVLFQDQTAAGMAAAIERLDELVLHPESARVRAEAFSTSAFRRRVVELFERLGVDQSLYDSSAETSETGATAGTIRAQ